MLLATAVLIELEPPTLGVQAASVVETPEIPLFVIDILSTPPVANLIVSAAGNVTAYQPHINTSTNELKISNASNNGFVTLGKINTTNFGHADLATANTFTARQTFNVTSSITVPVGTTAQRDGSPANGMFRYNSTLAAFEGYANNQWGEIGGGGGATGGGNDEVFFESDQAVTTNYTLSSGKNAHTVSPTINSGVTVTVPSGAILVIL